MLGHELSHALMARAEGIEIEVVDPRCLKPLDTETIIRSVSKTGRLLIAHEAPITGGFGGELAAVRIADFLRGPLQAPFEAVEPAFEALMALQALLHEPQFALRYSYRPGDLVIFDNRRLLHARDAFEGSQGHRWLQGCYLERDEVRSRFRMIQRARRRRRLAHD